jgi:hypothetical protein
MNGGMALFINYVGSDAYGMPYKRFGVVADSGRVIVDPVELASPPYNEGGYAILPVDYNGTRERVDYEGVRTSHLSNYLQSISGNRVFFEDRNLVFDRYNSVEQLIDGLLVASNTKNSTWRIFDWNGDPVTQENPGIPAVWRSYYVDFAFLFVISPSIHYPQYPEMFKIYSLDGNLLLDGEYYTIIPIGDKYMVRGKDSAGLVDGNNNFIIEVPIFNYIAD